MDPFCFYCLLYWTKWIGHRIKQIYTKQYLTANAYLPYIQCESYQHLLKAKLTRLSDIFLLFPLSLLYALTLIGLFGLEPLAVGKL